MKQVLRIGPSCPTPRCAVPSCRCPASHWEPSLQVVDAQGRAVHNGTWEGSLTMDWPAGWYAVRVATDQGLEHKALVIE